MTWCYKHDCLNHDRSRPGNCLENATARPGREGLCERYVDAKTLMRTFRCGCHKNARGRWVSDRVTVLR
jgi:hypothetical protein